MHDNDTVCKCVLLYTLCLERENEQEWAWEIHSGWCFEWKFQNVNEFSTVDDDAVQKEGTFCHELSRFNNFYLSSILYST